MKHFKYIVTYGCPKNCGYCVNKYLTITPALTFTNPLGAIKYMWDNGFTAMSITGGEPTTCMARVNAVAFTAKSHGIYVGLRTANPKAVEDNDCLRDCVVDDVVLGIHDLNTIPTVRIDKPVYGQVVYNATMGDCFSLSLALYERGYKGLTVVEEWPPTLDKLLKPVTQYANFSLRILKCDEKPFDLIRHINGEVTVGVGHLTKGVHI